LKEQTNRKVNTILSFTVVTRDTNYTHRPIRCQITTNSI